MADKRADFGNYGAKAVKADKTERFTFHDLEGSPTLEVLPATKHNRAYASASKAASGQLRRIGRGGGPDADKKAIAILAKLFSKHIVKGWSTPPVDSSGKKVPFSEENCEGFLIAIPDYMFDDPSGSYPSLFRFCNNVQNFTGAGLSNQEEDELAGN